MTQDKINQDKTNQNIENNQIEPGKHYVSKTYIPIQMFRGFWAIILVLAVGGANLIGEFESISKFLGSINVSSFLIIIFVGGFVLLMAILFLVVFLSYKRLTWEITEDEIHIYKGIIVKKKSHIPYRRIHSVDINAKILDRIFGVVTLKMDTAAGSAGSEDARIPALDMRTAELLRTEIFKKKHEAEHRSEAKSAGQSGTVVGETNFLEGLNKENDNLRGLYAGTPGFNMDPDSEYRLSNKELIIYCIANGKVFAVVFAILFFVYQAYGFVNQVSQEAAKFATDVTQEVMNAGPIIIVIIAVIALIFSLVASFLTRALTYGNFVVKRYGARIEVSTGLVQKKSTGVAVERIQTLKIKQGLLSRILGYAEISIETASGMGPSGGNEQQQNPGVVLHPFIKKDRIDDFMEKMLVEFQDKPDELEGLSKLAMRRSIFRYEMWTVILFILPIMFMWYAFSKYGIFDELLPGGIAIINNSVWGVCIAAFILMPIIGWGAWKGRAYGRNQKYLALGNGVLSRNKIYIPKIKIQYANVKQNPFQKRVNLTTVVANTAALGSSNQSLKDVDVDRANEYLDWIEHKKRA